MLRTVQFLIFIFIVGALVAQQDSTVLVVEKLTSKDIHPVEGDIHFQKVVSASRTLQSVEDLPFTVYVITKEDIRNNGYNTLVDALKLVPGIRVSQPGSGVDGETFMMRGLRGNSYAKILINSIPVKPIGIRGMPIGAQLPIRQAERIEVIYGPTATLYGADASAGVINIIIKESERPLYTKADISVGANGYSGMNIIFGGKAGKGKRILKYNVFGNFSNLANRNISDEYLYSFSANLYDPDSTFVKHPNYDSIAAGLSEVIPHQSRLFGLQLNYGAFNLTLMDMYRRDHSSIGLNPTAFSYNSPLNFIGENIRQIHLGYSRKKKKRAFNINLNALLFEADKNSSYRILNSAFNRALILAAESDSRINIPPLEDRIEIYYDNFIKGNRYIYDLKADISLDVTWNRQLTKHLEWMFGLTPRILLSKSEYFLRHPFPSTYKEDHTLTSGGHTNEFEIGGFTQFFYNTLRFKAIVGVQSTFSSKISLNEGRFFPRLAALYKLTPKLSLRAFYGTSFRTPSSYFSKNSYTIGVGAYQWILLGDEALKPEITKSFELGVRWRLSEFIYGDIAAFTSNTKNVISAGTKYKYGHSGQNLESITLGYFNGINGSSYSKVSGLQMTLFWKNIIRRYHMNLTLNMTFTNGREKNGEQQETVLREQSPIIAQLKLSFSPWKNFSVYIDNVYVSESENHPYPDILMSDNFKVIPGYLKTDFSLIGRLTDHFQVEFKVKNLFNVYSFGLAATGTSDDLVWNPQSLRSWELGFSYRME